MARQTSIHGSWSSRWVFILAATGSAVGLGNIWKFPYMAGENGGGAFVLLYLMCVAMIGIPVMMAEIMLGRRGRQSPINAMHSLAEEAQRHPAWALLGWSGVLAGFLILSFYSVVAGWALAYVPKMIFGTFSNMPIDQINAIGTATFNALKASPWQLTAWHTLFMFMTALIIAAGVEKGLERAVKFLMPALSVLLFILVGYAMTTGGFMRGVEFLFYPDFQAISGASILSAMGHAFFTLSLGMGAIMMYGAYLPKDVSITSSTLLIAAADTAVALLAGLAIFPVVFANGLPPEAGPGLLFISLPLAFGQIPGGLIFGTLFFILVAFAAWSSAISILEPAVAWLVETRSMKRRTAAILCAGLSWALGILTVLSFNWMSEVHFLPGKTFFDSADYLATNIMLPLGGLGIAIFVAWMMNQDAHHDELGTQDTDISYHTWLILIRYITPFGVLVIFLGATGLMEPLVQSIIDIWLAI